MALLFALVAFILAGMAFSSSRAIIQNMNRIHVRLDKLERAKGLAPADRWKANVRLPGMKPAIRVLVASNEQDALRQLIVDGVKPQHIKSLERVGDDPTAA